MSAKGTEKLKRVQTQNTLEEKALQRKLSLYTKEQRYIGKELERIVQAKKSLIQGLEQLNPVSPKPITRRKSVDLAEILTGTDVTRGDDEARAKSTGNALRETLSLGEGSAALLERRANRIQEKQKNIHELSDCVTNPALGRRMSRSRGAKHSTRSKSTGELCHKEISAQFDFPPNGVPLYQATNHTSLPRIDSFHMKDGSTASERISAQPFFTQTRRKNGVSSFPPHCGWPSSAGVRPKTTQPVASTRRSLVQGEASNSPVSAGRNSVTRADRKSVVRTDRQVATARPRHGFNSNTDILDAINLKSKFRQIGSVVLATKLIRSSLERKRLPADVSATKD